MTKTSNNITLDEMRSLVAVSDAGSITFASAKLGVIASTLSRSLSRLESKLGTSLIMRHTRSVALTHDGQELVERFKPILDSVALVESRFTKEEESPQGLLRINAASPALIHLIAPVVKGYIRRYPNVEIELQNNEEVIDIVERNADIAIHVGKLKDSSLRAACIGVSRRRLLASPEYLKGCGVPMTVDDLQHHTLLGLDGAPNLNHWPVNSEPGKKLKIDPDVHASSGEVLRQLALCGTGIACLTDFMTEADRHNGDLLEVLPADLIEDKREINALYYHSAHIPLKISCFIDMLRQFIESQSPSLSNKLAGDLYRSN